MSLVAEASHYLLNVYKRIPLDIVRGEDIWLFDKEGNCYLDLLAGIAVNTLGYCHPDIIKAVDF